MEVLADAAADEVPVEAEGAAGPKKRRSKLEVAHAKLEAAELQLAALEASVVELRQQAKASRLGPTKDAREAKAAEAEGKVAAKKLERDALQRSLQQIQQAAAVKKAAEEQRAAAAALKAEDARPMSDEAKVALVTIRLGLQHRFDNKVDKNENLWDVGVRALYQEKIDKGELPRSDARSAESLRSKYSSLHGTFKLYAAKVARMKASGAPGDEIENMTDHKNVTTKIFWQNDVQERAGTVPPYSINGGNAERGGEANPHKRSRKVRLLCTRLQVHCSVCVCVCVCLQAVDADGLDADELEADELEADELEADEDEAGEEGEEDEPGDGGADSATPGPPAKAMHMGGASKEKYRPKRQKGKQGPVLAFLERMMSAEHKAEVARRKAAETERKARELHELAVIRAIMGKDT